jgi:hypothetical protein
MANTQLCSLIFADIVRSSDIKADALKTSLAQTVLKLLDRIKSEWQVIDGKFTGDGLFICGADAAEMAEAALVIRDHFRNTDWKRRGFPEDVKIRVALDLQKVNLVTDKGQTNVTGQGIDRAARLEPITAHNEVWCSDRFAVQLKNEHVSKIVTRPLGTKQLPKGAGEEIMSEVIWVGEAAASGQQPAKPTVRVTGPRIARKIGRREEDQYVEESFDRLKGYFKAGIAAIEQSNLGRITGRFKEHSASKFTVDLYSADGSSIAKCKIWLAGDGNEIRYSSGRFDINEDNSWNESIHAGNDGLDIFLQPIGMSMMSGAKDKLSIDDIGEHCWKLFEQSFPRRH